MSGPKGRIMERKGRKEKINRVVKNHTNDTIHGPGSILSVPYTVVPRTPGTLYRTKTS